jgi:hypothetical protein
MLPGCGDSVVIIGLKCVSDLEHRRQRFAQRKCSDRGIELVSRSIASNDSIITTEVFRVYVTDMAKGYQHAQ